jgi:NAD(P)-dependent dehydrogenase (short-subunit alcohol dehydrogenase family)
MPSSHMACGLSKADMAEQQKVCLLTGAGSSFGEAFCSAFSDRFRIAAVWHQHRPMIALKDRTKVLTLQADLSRSDQVQRAVQAVCEELGDIDIVVNATGYRQWCPLADDDDLASNMAIHFDLNVRVPLDVTLAVLRQCWAGRCDENRLRGRCAVNISSTAGSHVYPGWGQGCYSAAKAALNLASCHLAAELGSDGIRVNAVAPNTFPAIVSWERLLNGVLAVIDGDASGQVLVLDADRSFWLRFDGISAEPEVIARPDSLEDYRGGSASRYT